MIIKETVELPNVSWSDKPEKLFDMILSSDSWKFEKEV